MNKKTVALTNKQYHEIISTIRQGFSGFKPNDRIATALVLEANLGIRVSDIVQLRLKDIVRDGNRWRLNIKEQKTQKTRDFTVHEDLYQYIFNYAMQNNLTPNDKLIDITERAVQKQLKKVCDYLGFEGIGTHSFRKMYATKLYEENNYNIMLVQELLQHSSPNITQRYIGLRREEVEKAMKNVLDLI